MFFFSMLSFPNVCKNNIPPPHSFFLLSTSNSSENGFIKIPVPHEPTFFFLERKDWANIKRQRGKREYSGLQWTNLIAEGLRTVYPYCSFAFKRHRVKAEASTRPGPAFWCLGYCRFEDCSVTVTLPKEEDLKATVNFKGVECVHNKKETKTRPVRADNRYKLGLEQQKQLPRAKYLELLSKIDDDVIRSGCRDEAPNPQVLRNISSEIRQRSRRHKNEILSLQLMLEEKRTAQKRSYTDGHVTPQRARGLFVVQEGH